MNLVRSAAEARGIAALVRQLDAFQVRLAAEQELRTPPWEPSPSSTRDPDPCGSLMLALVLSGSVIQYDTVKR